MKVKILSFFRVAAKRMFERRSSAKIYDEKSQRWLESRCFHSDGPVSVARQDQQGEILDSGRRHPAERLGEPFPQLRACLLGDVPLAFSKELGYVFFN
jgi:hypothetical protein